MSDTIRVLVLLCSWLLIEASAAADLQLVSHPRLPATDYKSAASMPRGLVDGLVMQSANGRYSAWLSMPTKRYDHAVLGDAWEAEAVSVSYPDGSVKSLQLPPDSVFEDRYPRWADLDADGEPELFLVKSYLATGAALVVIEVTPEGPVIAAETPTIGLSHRWLNPVGAADLDGDGLLEVAYVETPHIGGRLRIYQYRNGRLTQSASAGGFSNHVIGTRALQLSAILDVDQDGKHELLVPSADRRSLKLVGWQSGRLSMLAHFPQPDLIQGDFRVGDLDGDGDADLTFQLGDGRWVELTFP